MALIQSTAIPSGATDYELEQSLKFDNSGQHYLTRTPAANGNRRTWTMSYWVKYTSLLDHRTHFGGSLAGSDSIGVMAQFDGNTRQLMIVDYRAGYNIDWIVKSDDGFRDPSAWYHIVIAIDTTQATAANRVKLYANGVELGKTAYTPTYPSQNFETKFNQNNPQIIGGNLDNLVAGNFFDGYLTEMNFIDGQALTPADFGETGTYGEWKPIEYEGSYGTNGFYLNFAGGGVMSATGGTITTDGDYKVHSFTSNGTFTPSSITGDGYVEYLVIGGGGAGAADGSTTAGNGGGGAGGYRTGYLPVTAQAYSITVGAGGVGTTGSSQVNGANSVFSSITSSGGGGGGYFTSTPGAAGGSGGGGSAQTAAGGAANPAGQGNAGETATNGQGGGGGGGAGEAGGTDGTGQGGDGLASSITGSSVTRAGGGGGSRASGGARAGGTGGGGAGGNGGAGTSGTANTGSGGGAGVSGGSAGSGGSGIVIIRYKFQ